MLPTEPRVDVDDTLYGIAEVSRDYLSLERRRTRFLLASIVIALLMNVGWLVIAAVRDGRRTNTVSELADAVSELTKRNEVLSDTQKGLEQTVQAAIDQKIILEELEQLLQENRRSLDCVALYVSGRPSRSPDCDDVNARLRDLQRGRVVFPPPPPTTTTTRPRTTTTTRVPPPTTTTRPSTTTTTTTIDSRTCILGIICIGG